MNIQIQYQQILLQGVCRIAPCVTSLYLPMYHHRLWGHLLETTDKELDECSIAPALSLLYYLKQAYLRCLIFFHIHKSYKMF